jgi:hypothetical protein
VGSDGGGMGFFDHGDVGASLAVDEPRQDVGKQSAEV